MAVSKDGLLSTQNSVTYHHLMKTTFLNDNKLTRSTWKNWYFVRMETKTTLSNISLRIVCDFVWFSWLCYLYMGFLKKDNDFSCIFLHVVTFLSARWQHILDLVSRRNLWAVNRTRFWVKGNGNLISIHEKLLSVYERWVQSWFIHWFFRNVWWVIAKQIDWDVSTS